MASIHNTLITCVYMDKQFLLFYKNRTYECWRRVLRCKTVSGLRYFPSFISFMIGFMFLLPLRIHAVNVIFRIWYTTKSYVALFSSVYYCTTLVSVMTIIEWALVRVIVGKYYHCLKISWKIEEKLCDCLAVQVRSGPKRVLMKFTALLHVCRYTHTYMSPFSVKIEPVQ